MSEEGGVGGGHFLLYVSALKEAHCSKGKVTEYTITCLINRSCISTQP